MKPNVQKILQKFSTEKVELNIDEAKDLISTFNEIYQEARGIETELSEIDRNLITKARDGIQDYKNLNQLYDKEWKNFNATLTKIEKSAKDLGINAYDIPEVDKLGEAESNAGMQLSQVADFVEVIQKELRL